MARRPGKGVIVAEVTGIKEVARDIAALDKRIRNRVLKRSVDAGAKVFRTGLKASAPVESGLLRKSLGIKGKIYRSNGIYVAVIGPRSGFKQEVKIKRSVAGQRKKKIVLQVRDPIKYAHLVEALYPWMRPTFHAKQEEASSATTRTMAKEIDAAAKAKGA